MDAPQTSGTCVAQHGADVFQRLHAPGDGNGAPNRALCILRPEPWSAPVGNPEFDALPVQERRAVQARLRLCHAESPDAVRTLLAVHSGQPGWSAKRIANLRTAWHRGTDLFPPHDWRLLVNRKAAGTYWLRAHDRVGLPEPFVQAVRELFAENKRKMRPAVRKLYEWVAHRHAPTRDIRRP